MPRGGPSDVYPPNGLADRWHRDAQRGAHAAGSVLASSARALAALDGVIAVVALRYTLQVDTVATVNGYQLRYVQDSRFGRLVAVYGTNKAFATIDDAVAFAKSQRTADERWSHLRVSKSCADGNREHRSWFQSFFAHSTFGRSGQIRSQRSRGHLGLGRSPLS